MIGTFLSRESRIESSHRVGLIAQTRTCGPTDEFCGALSTFPLTKEATRKDGECQHLREINYLLLGSIIRLTVSVFSGPLIRSPLLSVSHFFLCGRTSSGCNKLIKQSGFVHSLTGEVKYIIFRARRLSHQGGEGVLG